HREPAGRAPRPRPRELAAPPRRGPAPARAARARRPAGRAPAPQGRRIGRGDRRGGGRAQRQGVRRPGPPAPPSPLLTPEKVNFRNGRPDPYAASMRRDEEKRRVTLATVADQAGVSVSTVSKV